MNDDFMTYIEEKFIFCTRCEDHRCIKTVGGTHPCPQCNLDEYMEWKKWNDEDKQQILAKEKTKKRRRSA